MINSLRTLVSAWKVQPYTKLQAADHRSWTYDRLAAHMCEDFGYMVHAGPYKGMRYFGPPGVPIIDEHPTTKILGTFEEELNEWIEALVSHDFEEIVHLGAAEGYHAVGLAMRLPESRSVIFDTLIASRKATRQLADLNGVRNRIQLRGFCGSDGLLEIDLADSLVFCDCGGAELTLLDPVLFPGLRLATIVVELHDFFDDRITPRLVSRFSSTHRIEFKAATKRDPAAHARLRDFSPTEAHMALDEAREMTQHGASQTWAMLTPYAA
jgi:hypothetical protein